MKRPSSKSWLFFDRIKDERDRTIMVQCKLCDNQYKFFGNTTNLRGHLKNIHPIQWQLSENGDLDDAALQNLEIESLDTSSTQKRKRGPYKKTKDVRYSINLDLNDDDTVSEQGSNKIPHIQIERVDTFADTETVSETEDAVREIVYASDNDVEEEEEYIPQRKRSSKIRRIKREVVSPPRRVSFAHSSQNETPFMILDNDSKKDEYSVFGEYVANKLRKLTDSRTKGNIQQLITTILWQAEYGAFDNGEAVKSVLWTLMQRPGQVTVVMSDSLQEDNSTRVQVEREVNEEEQNNTDN